MRWGGIKGGRIYSTTPNMYTFCTGKKCLPPKQSQWNLIKTFQTDANTPMITKMALKIFLKIFGRSY